MWAQTTTRNPRYLHWSLSANVASTTGAGNPAVLGGRGWLLPNVCRHFARDASIFLDIGRVDTTLVWGREQE